MYTYILQKVNDPCNQLNPMLKLLLTMGTVVFRMLYHTRLMQVKFVKCSEPFKIFKVKINTSIDLFNIRKTIFSNLVNPQSLRLRTRGGV